MVGVIEMKNWGTSSIQIRLLFNTMLRNNIETYFLKLRHWTNSFLTASSSKLLDALFGVGSTLGVNEKVIAPSGRGNGTGTGNWASFSKIKFHDYCVNWN